ncbi:Rieske (2Fe-2S) protein [soil metagenome]
MAPDESVNASLIRRSDLPNGEIVGKEVDIGGEREAIIIHREGDRVSAWRNVCPHQGRRLDYAPGKFLIDRGNLVCAAHGASFRLSDGRCVAGPCLGERLRALVVQDLGDGQIVVSEPP